MTPPIGVRSCITTTGGETLFLAWQSLLALGELWAERDYAQAGAWFQRAGEGRQVHERALRIFEEQRDTRGIAETRDLLGTAFGMLGERSNAVEQLSHAVDLFRTLADTPRLISSLTMRALQSMPGACETTASPLRPRDACVRDVTEALDLARQLDAPAAQAFAENALAHTVLSFGELGEALTRGLAAERTATASEHRQWMIASAYAVGHCYLHLLAPLRAIQILERARLLAEELGSRFWTATVVAVLARAHIVNKDFPAAQAALGVILPPRSIDAPAARLGEAQPAGLWTAIPDHPGRARAFIGASPWPTAGLLARHEQLVAQTLGEEDAVILMDLRLDKEVVTHAQSFSASSQRSAPDATGPAASRSLSARTRARSSASSSASKSRAHSSGVSTTAVVLPC
jgi:tetratricopeptide (TPR) repeat protein